MARTKTVRTLVATAFAVAVVTSLNAETITWTGGASGDWAGEGVWSPQAPAAGDDVVIENTSSTATMDITCSSATPALNSLTIKGSSKKTATLTMSGWDSKIEAATVMVNANGVLSCANGGGTEESLSRVWIVCTDLTVAANGKIDVTGKGYGGAWEAKFAKGFGPGAGEGGLDNNRWSDGGPKGASHGGYGGAQHGYRALPYGNAETPMTAGSSGGFAKWASFLSRGGGVVTVQASGAVTVNGSILASAQNSTKYGNTSGNDCTAGSGGSILIVAGVVKGNAGTIRADGGSSSSPTGLNTGRVGGGGRIAIKYDSAAQQEGFVSGMTISAAPGLYKWKVGTETKTLYSCDSDTYRSEADLGTLWFTDNKMLESLGTGISGQLVNISEITLVSLNMQGGHVRFPKDGVRVTITGDLTISGQNSRLEVGGEIPTNNYDFVSLYSSTPAALTVGGNVLVENRGRLDIRAAEVADVTTTVGASVKVDGAVKILTGGRIVAWSDCEKGGSPRFEVGSLLVGEDGLLTADAHGFAGGFALCKSGGAVRGNGFGPGGGRLRNGTQGVGGGHGGIGGGSVDVYFGGRTYDDPYYPCQAGSGGSLLNEWMLKGGEGGGVIDVRAVGDIRIEGRVSANGAVDDGAGHAAHGAGSGAGGTVFLYGKTVTSSSASSILACGADSDTPENALFGGGGGGRISIWAGAEMTTEGVKAARITRSDDKADMPEGLRLEGTVSAAAGTGATTAAATDGTTWFTYIADKPGLMLLLR